MAWACAVLEIRNEPLLRMIATAAASLDAFGVKDLAATAWAFAKVVFTDRPFFAQVKARAGVIEKEAHAKDISNIGRECGKVVHSEASLSEALSRAGEPQLPRSNTQGLSNLS